MNTSATFTEPVVKNWHAHFRADSRVKAYEKKGFSGVEPISPEPRPLLVLAQRKLYPYLTSRERHRNPSNLKAWQVDNLHLADQHAARIGLPLNAFITVSWLSTEHPNMDARAFNKCRKRMCQWLHRHGVQPAWLFVHENPCTAPGDTKPNTHLLVHVPKRLMAGLRANAAQWFDATMDGAVKVEPRTYRGHQGADRLAYMAKGAEQHVCRRYGGYRAPGGQGMVWGKRAGCSQNIAWKARQGFSAQYARKAGAV